MLWQILNRRAERREIGEFGRRDVMPGQRGIARTGEFERVRRSTSIAEQVHRHAARKLRLEVSRAGSGYGEARCNDKGRDWWPTRPA